MLPGSSLSEGRELEYGLWMGNLWREGAEAVQRRVKLGLNAPQIEARIQQ